MKTFRIIPLSNLLLPSYKAERAQYGLETIKEVKAHAADFYLMNPDWIRHPNGATFPFMENNGIIVIKGALPGDMAHIVKRFFEEQDQYFTSPEDEGWDWFGGPPMRPTRPLDLGTYRIAYRGGSGYVYGLNEYHPAGVPAEVAD